MSLQSFPSLTTPDRLLFSFPIAFSLSVLSGLCPSIRLYVYLSVSLKGMRITRGFDYDFSTTGTGSLGVIIGSQNSVSADAKVFFFPSKCCLVNGQDRFLLAHLKKLIIFRDGQTYKLAPRPAVTDGQTSATAIVCDRQTDSLSLQAPYFRTHWFSIVFLTVITNSLVLLVVLFWLAEQY